jgi:hypothetical protein
MNIRNFSCFRRRPHVVDILTPFVYGVSSYNLKWAQNFDGSFVSIINSSNIGFYDSNIPRNKTELQNTNGFVRITFDPTTFGITDSQSFWLQLWETPPGGTSATFAVNNGSANVTASVSQTGILTAGQVVTFSSQPATQYTLLSVTGTAIVLTSNYTGTSNAAATLAGLITAPTLLLPDTSNHGIGLVTIAGNAPAATSSAGSLQLDMPRLMQDWKIRNQDSTNLLYIATEQNGPEMAIAPDALPQFYNILGEQSSIWVRGATTGGTGASVFFSATASMSFPK